MQTHFNTRGLFLILVGLLTFHVDHVLSDPLPPREPNVDNGGGEILDPPQPQPRCTSTQIRCGNACCPKPPPQIVVDGVFDTLTPETCVTESDGVRACTGGHSAGPFLHVAGSYFTANRQATVFVKVYGDDARRNFVRDAARQTVSSLSAEFPRSFSTRPSLSRTDGFCTTNARKPRLNAIPAIVQVRDDATGTMSNAVPIWLGCLPPLD